MGQYTNIIINALIFFPLIAFIFTLPYIIFNYRKYGSVFSLRIAIVYSFILYLVCAYFLVILPLPSIEEVAALSSPRAQWIPFTFVQDIMATTSLNLSDGSSYLRFLNAPTVYQVLFNIVLVIPFGMYLRYYFKFSLKKTILFSFLLSLFFELTQLSGLYFIYPRGYRLFDVDDLMINTLGGFIGYGMMTPFMKVLPTRDEIDQQSYKRGLHVSLLRRIISFVLDLFFIIIIYLIIKTILNSFHTTIPYTFIILMFLYFIILPILWRGKTIGKSITKTRVVDFEKDTLKCYQPILRYGSLFTLIIFIPIVLWNMLNTNYDIDYLSINTYALLCGIIIALIVSYLFLAGIEIATHKRLFYEKLSKTKIISTIVIEEEERAPIEESMDQEKVVGSNENNKENSESVKEENVEKNQEDEMTT